MTKSIKTFLIMNLKDHFWDYNKNDNCYYSLYVIGDKEEHWFDVFFSEYFDFIEENYKAYVDYEEKEYNKAYHLMFDFDFDYLHDNFITEKDLRNELCLIAKTILQENTVYSYLNKDEIYYIDQYNKRTKILYTNLCEVKNEKEDKQTIMFTNMVKKLEELTDIDIQYTSRNTALVSYKGYAFDLEKMQKRVSEIMQEEKMNSSKVIMADPMLKEDSIRYEKLKKWVDHFREFYSLIDEEKKKKR